MLSVSFSPIAGSWRCSYQWHCSPRDKWNFLVVPQVVLKSTKYELLSYAKSSFFCVSDSLSWRVSLWPSTQRKNWRRVYLHREPALNMQSVVCVPWQFNGSERKARLFPANRHLPKASRHSSFSHHSERRRNITTQFQMIKGAYIYICILNILYLSCIWWTWR